VDFDEPVPVFVVSELDFDELVSNFFVSVLGFDELVSVAAPLRFVAPLRAARLLSVFWSVF
jgi:hypothetical protein